jgi:hypothetical protein
LAWRSYFRCWIFKSSKIFGETSKQKNKPNEDGYLHLVHGQRCFYLSPVFNINQKVGDFYFFPNYLMHTVYPFYGTREERRSVSFNAFIDENIYNVYGK